jgi:alanyl-tRNA synthetase
VVEALERLLERQRSAEKELARLRDSAVAAEAAALVAEARDGTLVARRDGRSADELRALALAARRSGSLRAVVLGGSPDGTKVSIVAATGGQPDAGALVKSVAAVVGGGGGGSPEVAVAGGREPGQLDEALAQAARLLDGG